jgi:hypothetical protein
MSDRSYDAVLASRAAHVRAGPLTAAAALAAVGVAALAMGVLEARRQAAR